MQLIGRRAEVARGHGLKILTVLLLKCLIIGGIISETMEHLSPSLVEHFMETNQQLLESREKGMLKTGNLVDDMKTLVQPPLGSASTGFAPSWKGNCV